MTYPTPEEIEASDEVKALAYDEAHEAAVNLGYPSIIEALEAFSAQPKPMTVEEIGDAIIEYPHASPMYRAKVLHARIYGGEG